METEVGASLYIQSEKDLPVMIHFMAVLKIKFYILRHKGPNILAFSSSCHCQLPAFALILWLSQTLYGAIHLQ